MFVSLGSRGSGAFSGEGRASQQAAQGDKEWRGEEQLKKRTTADLPL